MTNDNLIPEFLPEEGFSSQIVKSLLENIELNPMVDTSSWSPICKVNCLVQEMESTLQDLLNYASSVAIGTEVGDDSNKQNIPNLIIDMHSPDDYSFEYKMKLFPVSNSAISFSMDYGISRSMKFDFIIEDEVISKITDPVNKKLEEIRNCLDLRSTLRAKIELNSLILPYIFDGFASTYKEVKVSILWDDSELELDYYDNIKIALIASFVVMKELYTNLFYGENMFAIL